MDHSLITDYLYIAARPKGTDAREIRDLDVRLIISMVAHRRPPAEFYRPPLSTLWLRTFDFFLLPIPVDLLEQGVDAALPVIKGGHSVLTYCQAGRHRSVAMGAAILIGMGHSADEAMALIARRRPTADPYASHIERQIRKFEARWGERPGEAD